MNYKKIFSIFIVAVLLGGAYVIMQPDNYTDKVEEYEIADVEIPVLDGPGSGFLNPLLGVDTDVLIGMSEEEAQFFAATNNTTFRVVERDGEFLPVTLDYRVGRINGVINEGVVTGYELEGVEKAPKPKPQAQEEKTSESFVGVYEDYGTACFADGECYAVVDGKKITTIIGWSRDTVGSFENPDLPFGTEVEVYAQKIDDSTYTLYGSSEYYIREK